MMFLHLDFLFVSDVWRKHTQLFGVGGWGTWDVVLTTGKINRVNQLNTPNILFIQLREITTYIGGFNGTITTILLHFLFPWICELSLSFSPSVSSFLSVCLSLPFSLTLCLSAPPPLSCPPPPAPLAGEWTMQEYKHIPGDVQAPDQTDGQSKTETDR